MSCKCFSCKLERAKKRGSITHGETKTEYEETGWGWVSSVFVGVSLGFVARQVLGHQGWFSHAYANWVHSAPLTLTLPIDSWVPLFPIGTSPLGVFLTISGGTATITVPGVYRIGYTTTIEVLQTTENLLTAEADNTGLVSVGIFRNSDTTPLSQMSDTVQLQSDIIHNLSISDDLLVILEIGDMINILGVSESRTHGTTTRPLDIRIPSFNFNLQLIQPRLPTQVNEILSLLP